MKTVLSIDFDFWSEPHAFFDWGHREAPFFINGPIWTVRAAEILQKFKTLEEGVGLPPDEPKPHALPTLLRDRKCRINQLAIAESHASAYHYFKDIKDKLHLVHIDAHHDFGYGERRQQADGEWELECGNWIEHLVAEGRVGKITLIYPKWRSNNKRMEEDWTTQARQKLLRWTSKGIDMSMTPSLGLAEYLPQGTTFEKAFLCRSGAWTPPWLDDQFDLLAMGLAFMTKRVSVYTYKDLTEFNRKFDPKAAEQMAEVMKEQMRKYQEEHTALKKKKQKGAHAKPD